MRVDKLLWFLRLAGSRAAAQAFVSEGHIRIDGRRIEKCSHPVAVGNVLTLPLPRGVTVIEIMALPGRRGPAAEAAICYRTLDGRHGNPIAGEELEVAKGISPP